LKIHINVDRSIEDYEALASRVRGVVNDVLDRFKSLVEHVEVRLNEENGQRRRGDERRCLLEARLEGRQTVAVTHQAATPEEAVRGAAEKMTSLIESCFVPARLRRDDDLK